MGKFLLIVSSSQEDLAVFSNNLAKVRKAISYLEIFQNGNFQPPRRILVTSNTCGGTADLLKENFLDLFQTNLVVQNIPIQPLQKFETIGSIFDSKSKNADITMMVCHHTLERVINVDSAPFRENLEIGLYASIDWVDFNSLNGEVLFESFGKDLKSENLLEENIYPLTKVM